MLWVMPLWKPLVQFEHLSFIYPERFQEDYIFSERGNPTDYQVTLLDFSGSPEERSLRSYVVDDKTRDIIDHTPENWAHLIKSIREQSDGLLVISHSLSWPDASELSLQTLNYQISQTPNIVVGLDAEFNNTGAELPPYLENSVITRTSHKSLNLPVIDVITLPPSVNSPLFGISSIQGLRFSAGRRIKVPLLVHWGDAILPTTHLAALIAAHQIEPKEIIISPSGHIRLGEEGSILKIEKDGTSLLPNDGYVPSSASEILINPEKVASSKIILSPDSQEFDFLLATQISHALSQKPTSLNTYQRWSFPIEISVLIILTLLLQTRRLILILPGIIALFAVSVYLGHWFLIAPVLLILGTFLLLNKRGPRKTPPPEPAKEKPTPQKTALAKKTTPKKSAKKAAKKVAKKAAKKSARKRPRRRKKKRR